MKNAAEEALDEIANLCGCKEWEYPGQVVRDVKIVVSERDRWMAESSALKQWLTAARKVLAEERRSFDELLATLRAAHRSVSRHARENRKIRSGTTKM